MIGQAKRLAELNKLYGMIPETKFSCPVITITSGKGGTGKSFFTLNTALALAEVGKKILIVDLDKNLSNIHIMLNETPKETIYDFLMNKALLGDLIVKVNENLHCLFGDSGKTDHPDLDKKNVDRLFFQLGKISDNYDFILIDTASGIGEDIKSIIKKSTSVILVTNPEPTSIMDSYVVLKELKNINFDKPKYLVINKSPDLGIGSDSFNNLEKAVKHFLDVNILFLGVISNDLEVSKSIISQTPIMMSKYNPACKSEIKNIARKINNNQQVVNNNH